MPLRKKPFGQKQHIRALRWSMAGVAVFAFLFGALYQQMEQIVMWWAVTMAVYVGGMDFLCQGNAFFCFIVPFRRYLACANTNPDVPCGAEYAFREVVEHKDYYHYAWSGFQFSGNCPHYMERTADGD